MTRRVQRLERLELALGPASQEDRPLWCLRGVWFALRRGQLWLAPGPADNSKDIAWMCQCVGSWRSDGRVPGSAAVMQLREPRNA